MSRILEITTQHGDGNMDGGYDLQFMDAALGPGKALIGWWDQHVPLEACHVSPWHVPLKLPFFTSFPTEIVLFWWCPHFHMFNKPGQHPCARSTTGIG